MKTDIIFLGAGASVSAGFPLNAGLANYIIDELPKRPGAAAVPRIRDRWFAIGESLRRTGCLSVDEFCEMMKATPEKVAEMKRVVRFVLSTIPKDWKATNVEYRGLIARLFADDGSLNPRFGIINFNYDGLFGKLLADAVAERHFARHAVLLDAYDKLATIAGGFYSPPEYKLGAQAIMGSVPDPEKEFFHFMPHGTITVVGDGTTPLDFLNVIYPQNPNRISLLDGRIVEKEKFLLDNYDLQSLIHFPWEESGRHALFENQISAASFAAAGAKRIHFIGLSGHYLLRHTLNRIFEKVEADKLANCEWHLATMDPDPKRVFGDLIRCMRPDGLRPDLNRRLHQSLRTYHGFDEWLRISPHLRP